MERTIIRGNKALAEKLGVSVVTLWKWNKMEKLKPAIVSYFGRIILYDLNKVYECLNYEPVKKGRRVAI